MTFGREDYRGWELIPRWGKGPAYKLEWAAKREHPNGNLTYAGPFESRAAAEAWVDDNGVGFAK